MVRSFQGLTGFDPKVNLNNERFPQFEKLVLLISAYVLLIAKQLDLKKSTKNHENQKCVHFSEYELNI